jgi:hypothetical protein
MARKGLLPASCADCRHASRLEDAVMSDRRDDDFEQPAGDQVEPWLQVEGRFA